MDSFLNRIYEMLFEAYGPQSWWPGETPFEVIVGAVLTQNTAWQNVEKAISNLKREGVLDLEALLGTDDTALGGLIRPSGYYNIKVARLREVVNFLLSNGGIDGLNRIDTATLRGKLLGIRGVGEETADSILLYAFERPSFVVDAYTKRIFKRLRVLGGGESYGDVQRIFMDALPKSTRLYNEYHALIVRLAKECCRKKNPLCSSCPLLEKCPGTLGKPLIEPVVNEPS